MATSNICCLLLVKNIILCSRKYQILKIKVCDSTGRPLDHPAHSSLRKESPAELMLLTFVWDKTASGTARSKTENKHSFPFPMLLLAVPEAVSSHPKNKEQISCAVHFLCCSSLSQRQSCPIQK